MQIYMYVNALLLVESVLPRSCKVEKDHSKRRTHKITARQLDDQNN